MERYPSERKPYIAGPEKGPEQPLSPEVDRDSRRIGLVKTRNGIVQLSLDFQNQLRTGLLTGTPENDQSTLDLSWIDGDVRLYQLGLDPAGSDVVQDVGDPRLKKWHAYPPIKSGEEQAGDKEQWINISDQRLVHLFLDPLDPEVVDLSRLVKLVDEYGGVNYAILELVPDTNGDNWVDIPIEKKDQQIKTARLFLIQPPIENPGGKYGPKTSLSHLLNDVRSAVVDSHNNRDADTLNQLAKTIVEKNQVQFVHKDGTTPISARDDQMVLEALFKTQLVVSGLILKDHPGYQEQFESLIPVRGGRIESISRRVKKLSGKNVEPPVKFGVGDFIGLYDLDDDVQEETPIKGVVVENKAQGVKRNRTDLLSAYPDPRFTEERRYRWGPDRLNRKQRFAYAISSTYRNRLDKKRGPLETKRTAVTGLKARIKASEAEGMGPGKLLYETGTRLWDGSSFTQKRRLSAIGEDERKPLIEGFRTMRILGDNFLSRVNADEVEQIPADPINTKRNPFADRVLRYSNLYPHHVLRQLEIVNGKTNIDNLDYREWTDTAFAAWNENVVSIRRTLPDENWYNYYYARGLVSDHANNHNSRVHDRASNLVGMVKNLVNSTFAIEYKNKDLSQLRLEAYEVGFLQQIYFGLLTEYDRLAKKGATDEQFRPLMQQVHDISVRIIGIEDELT